MVKSWQPQLTVSVTLPRIVGAASDGFVESHDAIPGVLNELVPTTPEARLVASGLLRYGSVNDFVWWLRFGDKNCYGPIGPSAFRENLL